MQCSEITKLLLHEAMSGERREFQNPFEDFDSSAKDNILINEDGAMWQLEPSFERRLVGWRQLLLEKLEASLDELNDWGDASVYTGTSGLVLLYLHMHTATGYPRHLERAAGLVSRIPTASAGRRRQVTLLCGEAGCLAVAAVVYYRTGRTEKAQRDVETVVSMSGEVQRSASLPDELLYGRAGYLAVLLLLRQLLPHTTQQLLPALSTTVAAILSSGAQFSRQHRSPAPLMFAWHDKQYLGAAHGVSGIMTLLMQLSDLMTAADLTSLVRPTVDWLAGLRLPSGNYPSSLESSSSDRLVHWCHGAPGVVFMLCQAHQTFGDERYLRLAREAADVVWQRGLLRKGYGLCHGAAGNGYALLRLYQATQEPRYLYRAARYAQWCSDHGRHGCRTADRPVSLFEGLAGSVYFLSDLARPLEARFPGFCF